MTFAEAIGLLKRYGLLEKAENECKLKKISNASYDSARKSKIYCSYLSEKRVALQNKRNKLLEVKCFELDNIPDGSMIAHDDCYFVGTNCTKDYCKKMCKYYRDNIKQLDNDINELAKAEKALTECLDHDYRFR